MGCRGHGAGWNGREQGAVTARDSSPSRNDRKGQPNSRRPRPLLLSHSSRRTTALSSHQSPVRNNSLQRNGEQCRDAAATSTTRRFSQLPTGPTTMNGFLSRPCRGCSPCCVLTKIRLHAVDPQALEWQIPSNDQKVQEMSKDLRAIQLQKRGKKKHLCVFTNHQCH